jgi:hypothetical protein
VRVPPAKGSLVAILFVTVVEKLASSPNAAASSLSVFNAVGDESIRFVICVPTYASVATPLPPRVIVDAAADESDVIFRCLLEEPTVAILS